MKCADAHGQTKSTVSADMIVLHTPNEMRKWSQSRAAENASVGFVPTMGALHDGHMQLLALSQSDNECTVLSIFVNPMQFNNPSDFDKYPRTFDSDLSLAEAARVDVVYAPTALIMYPNGFDTSIDPGPISRSMEGEFRPGHFEGVSTVVVKLLNAVQPNRLYLGQKDYQQLAVLRHVVADLDVAVEVVGAPTVRDTDGLALSSRNVRLTAQHRKTAPIIYEALSTAHNAFHNGERSATAIRTAVLEVLSTEPECHVEYVSVVDSVNLSPIEELMTPCVICVAVQFGDVRLIDNIQLDEHTR
jgi:pantoate--beta-alanine ligase